MARLGLRGASPALVLCLAQIAVALVAGAIAGVSRGRAAAAAALFGGLVVIVPSAYFAAKVFLRAGKTGAEVLGAFYRAEVVKLVLTALLFWIGTVMFAAQFAPLMLTCIACLAMNWLVVALTRSG